MPGEEPWELWEGELRTVPGAGLEASEIALVIGAAMLPVVRRSALGVVSTADGTYLLARNPDTVVVPDVAFVRWERLPGRIRPKGLCPVPPDLAVEFVSPSDTPRDVARKMELYRRAGVPLVWWVYPERRTVIVVREGRQEVELHEGDELDGGDVLPGFSFPVAQIFAGV